MRTASRKFRCKIIEDRYQRWSSSSFSSHLPPASLTSISLEALYSPRLWINEETVSTRDERTNKWCNVTSSMWHVTSVCHMTPLSLCGFSWMTRLRIEIMKNDTFRECLLLEFHFDFLLKMSIYTNLWNYFELTTEFLSELKESNITKWWTNLMRHKNELDSYEIHGDVYWINRLLSVSIRILSYLIYSIRIWYDDMSASEYLFNLYWRRP